MIKILHTSDVHIGAKLNWLGSRAEEQRKQINTTFEKIVELAIKKEVQIVLIAGDLFDNYSPRRENIEFVSKQLAKLAAHNIYTFLISGNHDRLEINSVFKESSLIQNQLGYCFNKSGCEVYNIAEYGLNIFGSSIEQQFSKLAPLKELNKYYSQIPSTEYSIALVHGSYQLHNSTVINYPIEKEDIDNSQFDYIALGDWHSVLEVSNAKHAWYCGSPELLSKSQLECGHVLYVEIDTNSTKVEKISIGARKVKEITINIEKYKTDFKEKLLEEIKILADKNLVLCVELCGKRSAFEEFGLEALTNELCEYFYYFEIKDSTDIRISEEDLNKYPETTLVGRYIKNIKALLENEEDIQEKEILEEALFEGIQRILNGNKNK